MRHRGMKARHKLLLGLVGGGEPAVIMSATITGAGQTVTLQRITPTGAAVTVNWGDGGTSSIANGNTGTTTHVYATAGTYNVSISNPTILTYIDLRDTKLTLNSSFLTQCAALTVLRWDIGGVFNSANIVGLPITYLYVSLTVAGTYTFNSANIAGLSLTFLSVFLSVAGTYTFNSSNISAMALTSLSLSFSAAGTYTFNSSNISTMALTYLYLLLSAAGTYVFDSANISTMLLTSLSISAPAAGTYTFNSANISAMSLTYISLSLQVAGTYVFDSANIAARSTITNISVVLHATNTVTIAQADWDGFPACSTIRLEAALTQTQVDNVLLGLYAGFAAKTVTGGTIDLLGQSNAAPSGVLQAQCPPTTGYEAAYELVTDSCGVSTQHYTSVTTA